jgi:hypothetical protein
MALCVESFNRGAFSIKRDGAPLFWAQLEAPIFLAKFERAKKPPLSRVA